jgi:hypothetical protein
MRLIRLMLKVSVLVAAYSAILMLVIVPYAWLLAVVFAVWLCKKTYQLSAYGTARWAKPNDLIMKGMIDD